MAGFRDGDYSYKGLYDFDNLYMHPTNDKLSAKGLLTGSITGRYQTSNSFMEAIDTSIPQRFYKVFYIVKTPKSFRALLPIICRV